jgi:hypothetical protein
MWLAVGGVFRDAAAPMALSLREGPRAQRSSYMPAVSKCGNAESPKPEMPAQRLVSARDVFELWIKRKKGIWWMPWH